MAQVAGLRQRFSHAASASAEDLPQRGRDTLILAGAIAVAALVVFLTGQGTTYLSDEQIILLQTVNLDPSTLASPHHGSLMTTVRAVFYVVTDLFGADTYWLLRLIGYLGVMGTAALTYVLARRRIGSTMALAPAILILLLGTSWDVLLVPLNGIFWGWAVAAGLAAFVALERGTLLADAAAMVLLLLAVACGTVGVAFAAGAAVYVVLGRDWPRRAWVFAVPLLAYAAWFLWARKFHQTPAQAENVLLPVAYGLDSLGNAWAVILGLNVSVGDHAEGGVAPAFDYGFAPLLAIIAAAALGFRLWLGSIPRSMWALLAALVAFWCMSTLTASTPDLRTADASRYLFGVVVLVLLVTIDAVRGFRVSRGIVAVTFLVLVLVLPANMFHLVDARAYLTEDSRKMKTQLRMLELAGRNGYPGYVPGLATPDVSPRQLIISAGGYLDTSARIGSWAYSLDEVMEQDEETRQGADVVLAEALQLTLEPSLGDTSPQGCETVAPDAGGAIEAPLPPGGAEFRGTNEAGSVQLRRFGDTPAMTSVGTLSTDSASVLRIPEDAAPQQWVATIDSTTPVEICALKASSQSS